MKVGLWATKTFTAWEKGFKIKISDSSLALLASLGALNDRKTGGLGVLGVKFFHEGSHTKVLNM